MSSGKWNDISLPNQRSKMCVCGGGGKGGGLCMAKAAPLASSCQDEGGPTKDQKLGAPRQRPNHFVTYQETPTEGELPVFFLHLFLSSSIPCLCFVLPRSFLCLRLCIESCLDCLVSLFSNDFACLSPQKEG
jgi:hypothetical protein